MNLPDPPLLLITDRRQTTAPLPDVVEEAFEAGCRWVSLREKDLDPSERRLLLADLLALGERFEATVGIHADVEAAAALEVGALHLPAGASISAVRARFRRRVLLGVSTHEQGEVTRAEREGADYVTYSPVFESLSKPGYGRGGRIGSLAAIASGTRLPVIALGGIEPSNVGRCLDAGAAGVAVMGGVMSPQSPREVMSELIRALERAV